MSILPDTERDVLINHTISCCSKAVFSRFQVEGKIAV